MQKYAGTYYLAAVDGYRFIETDGVKLFEKGQGRRQELIPVSNNTFVRKGIEDMNFEFRTDEKGKTIMTVKSLRSIDYKKIR